MHELTAFEQAIAAYNASLDRGRTWRAWIAYVLAGLLLLGVGFGFGQAVRPSAASASPPHVMVILEENKGYQATLGTCSADPYLCGLASQYASVVGWTGVSHPSEPNYLAATTGGTQGCTSDTCFKTLTVPSIGGQLSAAGIPWTAYMESMPTPCYLKQWAPAGTSGTAALYGEKHDPFVVEGDVLNNACATHVLPYPGAASMVSTLDAASAPAFVWITPNQQDDMHSNTVQAGDAWLKANLAPVLTSPWFTNFDSTVIVTMDEHSGDSTGGGGAIPEVVISNNAKGKGNVSVKGNHYGTLRSIEEAFGLSLLGNASSGTDLSTLFGSSVTPPTPTPSSTISPTPMPSGSPSPSPSVGPATVTCSGDVTAKLQAAVNAGGLVTISAGTCALSGRIAIHNVVTVDGAGQTQTLLVQHAKSNIFHVTASGVTIENLNVNTALYNTTYPPISKAPDPGTIFSDVSNTSLINVSSEAGTGFGIRLTGPGPCYTHTVSGDFVENVISTNLGTGGFTTADADCWQNGTI